ncbi:uncharacterized protein LOC118644120 isoform X1 [Monomorium pharaonis]|uniref:uncharacterized protein LOC118644120 isoform X1 n=1 Tax=Monomorium pharaonis TaxID=307658 RepID=UPI001746646A|nr:uncharacterized protein LOC118644120 isoform X1 [Monomorium pharaonis]
MLPHWTGFGGLHPSRLLCRRFNPLDPGEAIDRRERGNANLTSEIAQWTMPSHSLFHGVQNVSLTSKSSSTKTPLDKSFHFSRLILFGVSTSCTGTCIDLRSIDLSRNRSENRKGQGNGRQESRYVTTWEVS